MARFSTIELNINLRMISNEFAILEIFDKISKVQYTGHLSKTKLSYFQDYYPYGITWYSDDYSKCIIASTENRKAAERLEPKVF